MFVAHLESHNQMVEFQIELDISEMNVNCRTHSENLLFFCLKIFPFYIDSFSVHFPNYILKHLIHHFIRQHSHLGHSSSLLFCDTIIDIQMVRIFMNTNKMCMQMQPIKRNPQFSAHGKVQMYIDLHHTPYTSTQVHNMANCIMLH